MASPEAARKEITPQVPIGAAELEASPDELVDAIHRLTIVMQLQIANQRSWRLALRNGLLAGLGGFLGATLVVSLVIAIMQPFKRLEAVGPMIDRLEFALRQPVKR